MRSKPHLLAPLLLALASVAAAAPAPPNIVLIIADDLGWNDVGYHGSEIRTPSIDRLASEGIRLERFYTQPSCTPTRAGLLTGRYPGRFGLQGVQCRPDSRFGLPPSELTLAEMLAQAGYERRALLGKWHLGLASTMFHPLNHGFTSFYGSYNGGIDYFTHERAGTRDWHRDYTAIHEEGYVTDLVGREAVRFVGESSADGPPFLLVVSFHAPHAPLQAKAEDLEAYGFDPQAPRIAPQHPGILQEQSASGLGARGRGNDYRQTYSAMVSAMDREIGRILDALDDKDLGKNTIVWFLSDNGGSILGASNAPLRGSKGQTREGGVRVPALVRWPARLPGGRTVGEITGYIDILPTLAAAARFSGKPPHHPDGIDLLPLLSGAAPAPDRYFYLGERSIAARRWKFENGSLFDVVNDPTEARDLASAHPEVARRLAQELLRMHAALEGPQTVSGLDLSGAAWPPKHWKLPEEGE